MKLIETYKGVKIMLDPKDSTYITVIHVGGFMGVIQTVHKSIEDARVFVDQDIEMRERLANK